MNFLLLNQFYPPDVAPTGQFLHDVARALVTRGHHVSVVCSRRSYDGGRHFPATDSLDGVEISRIAAPGFGRRTLAGKLADYAGFATGLGARLLSLRPRPDLIVALTTPPLLGLAARWAAEVRGTRHAHWVMDVYPDVLAAHGLIGDGERQGARGAGRGASDEEMRGGGQGARVGPREAGGAPGAGTDHRPLAADRSSLAWAALASLARAELRGSALTLALGPHMARRVEAHAGRPVPWVPLWGDAGVAPWPADRPVPLRAERGWNDLVLMYSGNMGLGHRFGEFLEAARRLGARGPRWAFCGGGARRGEIEAFARAHPEARVEVHPYVARGRLGEALAAGDVHLASLDAAWQGLMVPSKTQSVFAAGRPLIFVGARANEIAEWVEEAGAGWVVAEGDVEGLLAAVEAARDAAERARRGAAARRFAEARFDAAANVGRICGMLEGAAGA